MKEPLSYVEYHKRRDRMASGKMPTFDCHGLTYLEIEDKFENWLLLNSRDLPLEVITGHSDQMKKIVKKYLDKHDFMYQVPSHNPGTIIVI